MEPSFKTSRRYKALKSPFTWLLAAAAIALALLWPQLFPGALPSISREEVVSGMLDISTGVPSLLTDAQLDVLIPLMENAEKSAGSQPPGEVARTVTLMKQDGASVVLWGYAGEDTVFVHHSIKVRRRGHGVFRTYTYTLKSSALSQYIFSLEGEALFSR
ncbi:MAG: hypothetical protein KHW46_05380 [Clostridiales bacterium]|nr:hypothetical protein [Clostridiales bacterium]